MRSVVILHKCGVGSTEKSGAGLTMHLRHAFFAHPCPSLYVHPLPHAFTKGRRGMQHWRIQVSVSLGIDISSRV